MRRQHHRSYYARRRVPGSFTSLYLRAKVIPLAPKLLSALAVAGASTLGFLPSDIRSRLRMESDRLGEQVSEQSQSFSGTPDWTHFSYVFSVASQAVPGKSFTQQRHWTLSLDWIAQANFNAWRR